MCRSAFRRTQNRNVTGRSHEAGGIPSQYLPDITAHSRAGTGMSAGLFFTHGAAGLRPSVSSNPALSGFHSVQEKSEARWMYERLLAFCIRFFLNKNKNFYWSFAVPVSRMQCLIYQIPLSACQPFKKARTLSTPPCRRTLRYVPFLSA